MLKQPVKTFITNLLCVLSLTSLSACISLQDVNDKIIDNSLIAKSAIQYATLKYIDGNNERAEEILVVTGDVRKAFNESEFEVTVNQLVLSVRASINYSKLSPSEVVAVNTILTMARAQIDKDIREGKLDPDALTAPPLVIDWIEEAAMLRILGNSYEQILGDYR